MSWVTCAESSYPCWVALPLESVTMLCSPCWVELPLLSWVVSAELSYAFRVQLPLLSWVTSFELSYPCWVELPITLIDACVCVWQRKGPGWWTKTGRVLKNQIGLPICVSKNTPPSEDAKRRGGGSSERSSWGEGSNGSAERSSWAVDAPFRLYIFHLSSRFGLRGTVAKLRSGIARRERGNFSRNLVSSGPYGFPGCLVVFGRPAFRQPAFSSRQPGFLGCLLF